MVYRKIRWLSTVCPHRKNYQTPHQNIVYSGPEVSVTGKALWYIESHLGEELSLDTIACAVSVSRFHLSRAFAVSIGCSLAGYVRARRLSQAVRLLAEDAGFQAADGPASAATSYGFL